MCRCCQKFCRFCRVTKILIVYSEIIFGVLYVNASSIFSIADSETRTSQVISSLSSADEQAWHISCFYFVIRVQNELYTNVKEQCMKINSVFWVSRIWVVLGPLFVFSSLLVPRQVHASGGKVHVEIRIPSLITFQYVPTVQSIHTNLKVGASRDLRMQRAILIERTETPLGRDQNRETEKQAISAKREHIIIHTL